MLCLGDVLDPSIDNTALANSTSKRKTSCSNKSPGVGCSQHIGFKKGMAIASLNVNGLRSHLDEVQLLIKNSGLHILALNETKLDPHYPKELTDLVGYQQERLERTCNGGGVSIYIRDSISYKPR